VIENEKTYVPATGTTKAPVYWLYPLPIFVSTVSKTTVK
jgi:hypothetical protein